MDIGAYGTEQQSGAIEVFCCYAREDTKLLDELRTHLSSLQKQKMIEVWYDGDIRAGKEWDQEIRKHLNNAKIILLLISSDFINSDYCYHTEMQQALERHKRGEARVISVIVRPTAYWKNISSGDIKLGDLQVLPIDAKPVTKWTDDHDSAWEVVVGGVKETINEVLRSMSVPPVDSGQEQAPIFDVIAQKIAGSPTKKLLGASLYTLYWGHSEGVRSVAWSPDGKYIASGSHDGTIQVWETLTGKYLLTYREHKKGVCSVAWSPDGKYIASAGEDRTVQVWDALNGNTLRKERCITVYPELIISLAWSPDGEYIVSGGTSFLGVWHAMTGKNHRGYGGHGRFFSSDSHIIWSVSWSPNDKYIASGDGSGIIHVWNPNTGKKYLTYKGHSRLVRSISWSPDSNSIASASDDGTVEVWEALTGKPLLTYREHKEGVFSVAWSPNGKYIASGSVNAQVWDSMTGNTHLAYHGHSPPVISVAWSPDGERIASGSWGDTLVQVWDAR